MNDPNAPLDAFIEEQMKARGFLRHGEKTGHWRSTSTSGHDIEIRHRTIRRWLSPLWGDRDVVMRKFKGEVDALIAKGKARV